MDEEKAASEIFEDSCAGSDYADVDIDNLSPNAKSAWTSLFSFYRQSNSLYPLVAACIATIISGLVVPAMSVVLGNIFDALTKFGFGTYNKDVLKLEVSLRIWELIWLGIISLIFSGLFVFFWQLFGELQSNRARELIFEGLIERELEWFDLRKNGVAAMLTASQTQIGELETALGTPLGLVIQSLVTSITCIIIAWLYAWDVTLIIIAGLPFAGYIQYHLHSKLPGLVHEHKRHLAESSKSASRAISNISTVKCLNGETFEFGVFSSAVKLAARAYRLQARHEALKLGIFQFVTLSMFMAGFWYGQNLVSNDVHNSLDDFFKRKATTAGDVMTATWSCLMAAQHLQMMVPHLSTLEKGKIAGARLRSIISKVHRNQAKECGEKRESKIRLTEFLGHIKFHSVSFAYPSRPTQLALRNVSLSIAINKTTWIVGKSGSGKSSIGSLILKAYTAQGGLITLDDYPLDSLDTNWLRENITLVQQNSVLFDDTIFQNIALGKGKSEVTSQQAIEALFMAGGEDLLADTESISCRMVGVKGGSLSSGQKQRIVLARAILRNTPFLILDEAVSALDRSTRLKAMESIAKWRKGRTTIIITHDISQIPFNDMVYFLDNGEVAESGVRSQLEDREDGNLRNFLQISRTALMNAPSTPEDSESGCAPDFNFPRGKSAIGLSSGADRGLSRTSDVEAQRYHPHRRKISAWASEIPSRNIHSPDLNLVSPLWESKDTGMDLKRRLSANLRPTNLFSERQGGRLSLKDILLTIWPSLGGRYRMKLVLGIIAALTHAAATPLFSFYLSKLLEAYFSPNKEAKRFKNNALTVLLVAIIDGLTTYAMRYYLESVSEEWVGSQKNEAYLRILKQPLEWFEDHHNGVSRITEVLEKHSEDMKSMIACFAGNVLVGLVMLVIAAIWALVICWKFTLIIAIILLVMLPLMWFFQRFEDICEEKCNSAAAKSGEVLREAVENVSAVKMMQLEGYFRTKYHGTIKLIFKAGLKRCAWAGIAFALTETFMLWALASILYYGTYLIVKEGYGLEPILAVLTLLTLSLSQATSMLAMISQLSGCKDSARRLLRLSQLSVVSHESSGTIRPTNIQGNVDFSNLSFTYKNNLTVLDNISLNIPAQNPPLIITGPSGSGKSTLFKLLLRLYPSPSGSIKLDDTAISNIDIRYLREMIAFVPASPSLFDGLTILENIAYGSGSSGCSPDDVYAAAKLATIHDFIISLPQGYDTVLHCGHGNGSGGFSLSGGQAQRVAIARAITRKPKVLLLDEPTSALDVESEKVLWENLRELADVEGVTVVVATHGNAGNVGAVGAGQVERRIIVSGGKIEEREYLCEI